VLRIRIALAALALGLPNACARDESPPPAPPPEARCEPLERPEPAAPRNVLFVLADTLRRDRLGAYGGPADTPRFDAFAREHLLFTAAETQAPWTKPAIATLFTGLPPSAHGVVSHPKLRRGSGMLRSDVLGADHHTLAESLAAAGYRTAAFVSNPWVQRSLGFDQGFETWDESMARNDAPGEIVTEAGLRWLREGKGDGRPWLLYLHYMDPHSPYHALDADTLEAKRAALAEDDRPLTDEARRDIARLARDPQRRRWAERGVEPSLALFELVYDQGVEHFDRAFGQLLEGVRRRADWADTAVIVTSDHGEALFTRGYRDHGRGLHRDEIAVPLAARLPGVATEGAISCPVGLIDLRATLCDYLGVPCLGRDRGTSLFVPEVAAPDRLVTSEAVVGRPRNRAVRDVRYKLLYEPARGPAASDASTTSRATPARPTTCSPTACPSPCARPTTGCVPPPRPAPTRRAPRPAPPSSTRRPAAASRRSATSTRRARSPGPTRWIRRARRTEPAARRRAPHAAPSGRGRSGGPA